MIVVTGGAGFIGSNLLKALGDEHPVLVVDDLSDGTKFRNIVDCNVWDYWDKDRFQDHLQKDLELPVAPRAVFHQGACSDTTEWDGRFMMENNFEYSKRVLDYCLRRGIPFLYASSASVYGQGPTFREERQFESPLNVYGYSKLLFDRYVSARLREAKSQVVGLRYFNVYGPREQHKHKMASVAFHLRNQLLADGEVRLFEGCDGYGDGEQRRDFIHVDDVVAVNRWFLDHPQRSGIFNLGTGRSQTFNDVARAVIDYHSRGVLRYVPFPDHLRGRYQSFTEADLGALRQVGYDGSFLSVKDGVAAYMRWLEERG